MTRPPPCYPVTPDGRYFVVRGRLWRRADPGLDPALRESLVRELMAARRAKQQAMRRSDADATEAARQRVDVAKRALGERGPPWWNDGTPDQNRRMVRNSSYAAWYAALGTPDAAPAAKRSQSKARGGAATEASMPASAPAEGATASHRPSRAKRP